MIIAKIYYSITKQDESVEIEEHISSSNINERIIQCLSDYIDAENTKKGLASVEKFMYISIWVWIFLWFWSNFIYRMALQKYGFFTI